MTKKKKNNPTEPTGGFRVGAYRPLDATRNLFFTPRQRHIDRAECGDRNECVVAQVLSENGGEMFERASVGAHITKLFYKDWTVVRYRTPSALRKAIIEWDLTGKWNLPVDQEFALYAPSGDDALGASKAGRTNKPYASKCKDERHPLLTVGQRCPACKKIRKNRAMHLDRALPTRSIERVSVSSAREQPNSKRKRKSA